MSCGAIRSSTEMSSATVTISLLRLSPKLSFRAASSSAMILTMRAGLARMSCWWWVGECWDQVADRLNHFAILIADLVLLQAGKAAQLQVDDPLRLLLRQVV